MTGFDGNDTYVVNDEADVVVEQAGGGTDTIVGRSGSHFELPAYVERLVLEGTRRASAYGNKGDNRIVGNRGANYIEGGPGNDVLTGRAGADVYLFRTALDPETNVDRITDFDTAEDRIELYYIAFRGFVVGDGYLHESRFHVGASATRSSHRIVYDPASGYLYYDGDGSGPEAAVPFARLGAGLPLRASSFFIRPRYWL
jgi:Ca2+-binding RTX toxin-like protein